MRYRRCSRRAVLWCPWRRPVKRPAQAEGFRIRNVGWPRNAAAGYKSDPMCCLSGSVLHGQILFKRQCANKSCFTEIRTAISAVYATRFGAFLTPRNQIMIMIYSITWNCAPLTCINAQNYSQDLWVLEYIGFVVAISQEKVLCRISYVGYPKRTRTQLVLFRYECA